jgi:predicted nucleic acid-binding protein
VYLDSDVYVDLLEQNVTPHPDDQRPRHEVALDVFQAIERGEIILCASAITQSELGCNHAAKKDNDRVQTLLDGWFTARSTEWIEVDRHLAREAASLHGEWRGQNVTPGKKMSAADAVHLAAAIALECDYLMTYDGGFPIGSTVNGVRLVRPTVVWQEGLWAPAVGE